MRLVLLYIKAFAARINRHFRKKSVHWFISDLHFSHQNVINYCKRPFSNKEQMDAFLIFQWNCYIDPQDTVYCLGDFSLNRHALSIIGPKLNGRKFLVSGNHDKTFLKKESSNKKVANELNRATAAGWTVTQKIELGALRNGEELAIIMTHLPPVGPNASSHDTRYLNERIEHNPKALHLHGHLHGRYIKSGNMLDCGWDVLQRPITFKEIMSTYESTKEFIPSHLTEFYAKRPQTENAG